MWYNKIKEKERMGGTNRADQSTEKPKGTRGTLKTE